MEQWSVSPWFHVALLSIPLLWNSPHGHETKTTLSSQPGTTCLTKSGFQACSIFSFNLGVIDGVVWCNIFFHHSDCWINVCKIRHLIWNVIWPMGLHDAFIKQLVSFWEVWPLAIAVVLKFRQGAGTFSSPHQCGACLGATILLWVEGWKQLINSDQRISWYFMHWALKLAGSDRMSDAFSHVVMVATLKGLGWNHHPHPCEI